MRKNIDRIFEDTNVRGLSLLGNIANNVLHY